MSKGWNKQLICLLGLLISFSAIVGPGVAAQTEADITSDTKWEIPKQLAAGTIGGFLGGIVGGSVGPYFAPQLPLGGAVVGYVVGSAPGAGYAVTVAGEHGSVAGTYIGAALGSGLVLGTQLALVSLQSTETGLGWTGMLVLPPVTAALGATLGYNLFEASSNEQSGSQDQTWSLVHLSFQW